MMRMNSLKSKLSLTILLLAAPIFLLSLGILFTESRRMIRKEAVGRATSVLEGTMERMYRYMQSVETATEANCLSIAGCKDPDSLFYLSRYIVSLNGHIDGCSISMEPDYFPQYGRYYSAYTIRDESAADSMITVVEEPYEYFSKVWYKAPVKKGSACWVDFYDETDSLEVTLKGMIASYSKPIYNASGALVAVISTDISLRRLSRSVNEEKPYPHSYFLMLNDEGYYFVHPDSARLFTESIFNGAEPGVDSDVIALGHEMTKGRTGNMFLNLDGVPCLVTYQPVPGTSWSLALVCPDSDILEGYHQQTYIIAPLLLFGILFILLLCYHAVANAIGPLNDLLVKTQSITDGNMEVYIPRSEREDAVGRLQNSFARMLQSLNFHMGSVRYSTELTQRRYEELERATRLAEEADRQKTTFIQNVSHQIRTPLNILMGFTQILSSSHNSPLTDEELKNITQTLDYNSKLLNRMVVMLFDSSDTGFLQELNSNKADKVLCNQIARDTIDYIKLRFPATKITLQTDVDDDFCIQTNSIYLLRSLRELLYNSAKYSDGEHVSITINVGDTVRFTVQDTGKGIAEEDRERMFTFFAKVDDLSEGLGLGLPLAKRHILNLGGDLTLDSSYHDGCRFIIELPYK